MSTDTLANLQDWLQSPISKQITVPRWVLLAFATLLLFLALFLMIRSRKKLKKTSRTGTTVKPDKTYFTTEQASSRDNQEKPDIEVFNLQGLGTRTEQQDCFTISAVEQWSEQGCLAVLCDGMGGLADGAAIADELCGNIRKNFPIADFVAASDKKKKQSELTQSWSQQLEEFSQDIHARFEEKGGTTLVQIYLYGKRLYFWSVGDSDIVLLRRQKVYTLNQKHEYINTLFLDAAYSGEKVAETRTNPNAAALSHFMGRKIIHCDYLKSAFSLEENDRILLCSDGVSDTLSQQELTQCLQINVNQVLPEIEKQITFKNKVNQDNYTAILIAVNRFPTSPVT